MDGEHTSNDNSNSDAVCDNKSNWASNPQKVAAEVDHPDVRTDHPSKKNASHKSAAKNVRTDQSGKTQARSSTQKKSGTRVLLEDIEDISSTMQDSTNFHFDAVKKHPKFQRAMATVSMAFSRQIGVTDAEFEKYLEPTDDVGSSVETQLLSYILQTDQVHVHEECM